MYPPPHHQSDDINKMIAVIEAYPLATLVTAKGTTPYITHIPIIYNKRTGKLVAHIDVFNPQIATLQDKAPVTVIFKGPDSYISPSIYTTKQLPTWNYIIVHVEGTITLINDPEEAKKTMVEMTHFLESPDHNYILKKDNKAMEAAVNYIQAFEITITKWEGKFKLSQDKNKQDQAIAKQQLIKSLTAQDATLIHTIYNEI